MTVGTVREQGSSSAPLRSQVSRLLGIEGTELSTALCTRRLITRDDEITVPLNLEQARSREIARDRDLAARSRSDGRVIAISRPGERLALRARQGGVR